MLDVSEAEGRAAALVNAAMRAGADAADVLYIGDASTEVQATSRAPGFSIDLGEEPRRPAEREVAELAGRRR